MAFLILVLSRWLFQMNRHALQQGFKGSGHFASRHQIAVQLIEVAGILTQGSNQRVAAGNMLFQRFHQFAQLWVSTPSLMMSKACSSGMPALEQGSQLASEQSDICGRYARLEGRQCTRLLAHSLGADSLLAQLHLDQRKVMAGDRSGYPAPFAVDALQA